MNKKRGTRASDQIDAAPACSRRDGRPLRRRAGYGDDRPGPTTRAALLVSAETPSTAAAVVRSGAGAQPPCLHQNAADVASWHTPVPWRSLTSISRRRVERGSRAAPRRRRQVGRFAMPPRNTRKSPLSRPARKNRYSPGLVPRYTLGNSFVPLTLNSPICCCSTLADPLQCVSISEGIRESAMATCGDP